MSANFVLHWYTDNFCRYNVWELEVNWYQFKCIYDI